MTINKQKTNAKGYYTLARVLFFYICSVAVFAFVSGLAKKLPAVIADHISLFTSTILTFLLVYLFTRWEKLSLNDVGVVPGGKSLSRFFIGYLIGLAMAITQALLVVNFSHSRLSLVPDISVWKILLPLLLYLLVGSREELVFRSYFLRSLNYSFTSALALTIMTVIFILEHVAAGMTWEMAIVGPGAGGILFGLAALKTKGLALPLGLHSAWNFGQWSLGFKNKPGIWEVVVEKGQESNAQNVGLGAFLLVMALTITGILLALPKSNTGSPCGDPVGQSS